MVSIALVMAVIVTNIYAKKDAPQRCPAWCVRLVSRFYPAYLLPGHRVDAGGGTPHSRSFPLPAIIERPTTTTMTQPCSARPDMSHLSSPHFGAAAAAAAAKADAGDAGDCAGHMSCCRCLRWRVTSHRGRGAGGRDSWGTSRTVPSRGHHAPPTTLETFDFRRSEAEWRMVAKFTDRVFFWLFLVMSLCVQANLFLQMIPETRHAVV